MVIHGIAAAIIFASRAPSQSRASPYNPFPPLRPFLVSPPPSNVPGFPRNTIVLYFREPVLLKRVVVLELGEPGVQEVGLEGRDANRNN